MCLEKTYLIVTQYTAASTCTFLRLNPGLHHEKPAINCLNYGMAPQLYLAVSSASVLVRVMAFCCKSSEILQQAAWSWLMSVINDPGLHIYSFSCM
jgi:hypothetical protein